MAFAETASVKGNPTVYALSPQIKKYTLCDVGFSLTRAGNFQLERPLDPSSPYNQAIKLKITVAKDLKTFKMAVTTGNGLQTINIFKQAQQKDKVTQFNFVIENLLKRQVLEIKKA